MRPKNLKNMIYFGFTKNSIKQFAKISKHIAELDSGNKEAASDTETLKCGCARG
jgi:hypothetical protein